MANPVTMTAVCNCSFGLTPCTLLVTSQQTVMMNKMPAATIMDFAPVSNLTSFGMCSCPANPAVAAATAAAMGALTPAPCVPVTVSPWKPGCSKVTVGGKLLLNNSSKLNCMHGGVIQVSVTPAMTIKVP